jgi:porphobilinogen synthase
MIIRPRRLRATPALRRLVAETRLHPAELVLPMFVREGMGEPVPVTSMPGVVQHSLESLRGAIADAADAGIGGVMLFGIPEHKDAIGSGATDPDGILNVATRVAVAEAGDALVVQTDLCLDEFTDHGHCGVLREVSTSSTSMSGSTSMRSGASPEALEGGSARGVFPSSASGNGREGNVVDNDASLERYRDMAVAQAEAGSQLLGLSGMMDGQVAAVRDALDAAGHTDVPLLGYAAKYASAFYGPFREAVQSSLVGDRRSYQLDPANAREGQREVLLDVEEGADIVMVKPAMSYLDVLAEAAAASPVPVWAYQVSGEYAMIEAASANGWIDRDRAVLESVLSIKRAGADAVLTYYAVELARTLRSAP